MTAAGDSAVAFEPFAIDVAEELLDDLRERVRRTRWPAPAPGTPWEQGTDLAYLRDLAQWWEDGFDWRAEERALNAFPQFMAAVDGLRIHFVHARAVTGSGIPILLGHGWPSCFVELLRLVPLLTDPAGHGFDGPSFDVVIPSLPGYTFSTRPDHLNYRSIARLWHSLMAGLGYERYGAGGGDFGAGVASWMALERPESVVGLHLTNLELSPWLGPGSRPLSDAERLYVADRRRWDEVERGYSAVQSTRPQTLGYALNDSPVGLAAWIVEKWRTWSDTGGDPGSRFSRDFLLTIVTLYWVTGTITGTLRDYYDNRWLGAEIGPGDVVRVPTAVASFTHNFAFEGDPPREWAERLYDIRRFTPMPRGGHFAPAEEPELVARDILAFFAERTGTS